MRCLVNATRFLRVFQSRGNLQNAIFLKFLSYNKKNVIFAAIIYDLINLCVAMHTAFLNKNLHNISSKMFGNVNLYANTHQRPRAEYHAIYSVAYQGGNHFKAIPLFPYFLIPS